MDKARKRIDKALEGLRTLGIEVRSYTVYPGQGRLTANITVRLKDEGKALENMPVRGSVQRPETLPPGVGSASRR
jgi:hypothetical protein